MKKLRILFIISLLWACNKPVKLPLDIHLAELQKNGLFEQSEEISIPYDKMYKKPKKYLGLTLKEILADQLCLKKVDHTRTRLIFQCNDNYVVSMPLDKALSKNAYIVYKDLEAPKGKNWIDINNQGKKQTPAPYYMIWKDAPIEDNSFVWPYQLTTILVVSMN